MPRFKIWRASSNAVADAQQSSALPPSAPPPVEVSMTPPGSPKADPIAPSAPAIIIDQHDVESSSPHVSFTPHRTPQTNSGAEKTMLHWHKEPAGYSIGPWSETGRAFRAFKPPQILNLLDTEAHDPRSPIAWFIDQLGIQALRIIPRVGNCLITSHCEYELGHLNISQSIPSPSGYREPFTSNRDFADGGWRDIPIFSTPIPRNPLRMTRACETFGSKTERITISFKVVYLDTNEQDQYTRTTYEESWTYLAFDRPTLETFYEDYGQVLTRTTEEHRAAREFYKGPWKVDGRQGLKIPKMYEESKKFLKVDGDAERTRSREMQGFRLSSLKEEHKVGAE